MIIGFYALGLVAILASIRTIMHANPIYAILNLIVSLLAVAGIFFILGAPFAGILEMIVYAGAILVLFVFVMMMLNLGNHQSEKKWLSAQVWATPIMLCVVILAVFIGFIMQAKVAPLSAHGVGAKEIGMALYGVYAPLVITAAFLLLGALVAAYHLGKKALDDENESHFQNRPSTQNHASQKDMP